MPAHSREAALTPQGNLQDCPEGSGLKNMLWERQGSTD